MWKKIQASCDECSAIQGGVFQQPNWNPTPQKHKGKMKFKKGKGQDKDKVFCDPCWQAKYKKKK